MPDSFGQWARDVRKRLRRVHVTKRDDEPEIPYLPPNYRVPLTAQPSTAPSISATVNSALFTRLPPEARQQILVAAFGGRTLHMNLRLGPPLLPFSERPPIPPSALQYMPHGGISAELEHGQWPEEVLHAARRARVAVPGTKPVWQWWGCECHRNLPPGDERVVIAPWQDRCVRGEAKWCNLYPGDAPGKCLIGCLGWLMTCRQAYNEGINVLYSTNTIFMASRKLIDTLILSVSNSPLGQRVLVPPHRLVLLTKLELVWDWALFIRPEDNEQQTAHRADMVQSLGLLPRAFPNLVTIFISYSDVLYRRPISPDKYLGEIDRELLLPLSEMVSQFSRLDQCVVELPTCTFRPLMSRAQRSGTEVDKGRSWQDTRFWWEPDCNVKEEGAGSTDETPETSRENQPDQKDRLKGRVGFWVKSGVESDLFFDYQGRPGYLSTQGQVLF
ncbi:hypothetical protein CONLIGDRAFT_674636 [Coniochaeta ligniaria NRRL 30616]|uniref:Uncharacterized protein n=1 Tax=Coniochaeta ligniaria NRRL 30616 TaxID=1408157 RepID=A0A1J7I697_9PEZI|nr:hypothetical protein CONLIGDRAFT_674636 [Coniochaeta ligniaria NRRL 30616]